MAEPKLILSVFATFAVGGPQVRFCAVANRLGQRVRHVVLAMDGNVAAASRLDPALELEFPAVPVIKGDTRGNLLRFRAWLQVRRPALMVTHNWGSIEWAMARLFTGVPHIHIADGFGPEERATQIPRRVWTRRLVLRGSTVVVPSRTLERIAQDIWHLPDVRYTPNGIDLAAFAPVVPVIGTVAALRPEKNLARLLRACALLTQPWNLVIAGDGPERPALEALAATLGLAGRVRFAGHVAAPQSIYPGFDIVALSSDTEQMPISVLEAMGCGLPVAATDVGDIAAMLAPANRPFVVPQDDAALAAALDRLLADSALRAGVGRENRSRAEAEFDQERMFAAYAGLFGVG
jgi:glycosyltransferase involved in cell wall biosynthesis